MSEEKKRKKPIFTTIKKFEKEYGSRNFVEVALKETNNGENVFFSISKGFITHDDVKRYKRSLGFAASEEMNNFLVDSLTKLGEEFKNLPKQLKLANKQNEKEEEEAEKVEEE